MATLYIVATPIGNLEDITLRSLRILSEVDLIVAEDTRTAHKLLRHHGISTPVLSYHDHSGTERTRQILKVLQSANIALVSEAGMPGISDPGYELINIAYDQGQSVVSIPGASAVTTALAVSGFPGNRFLFLGFLPRRRTQRQGALRSVAYLPYTLVMFETPHRLRHSLEDIDAVIGDRPIAICRELTKMFEEIYKGTARDALQYFGKPRGEFTLVMQGKSPGKESVDDDMEWIFNELQKLRSDGMKVSQAIPMMTAATGLPRREIYRLWLTLK